MFEYTLKNGWTVQVVNVWTALHSSKIADVDLLDADGAEITDPEVERLLVESEDFDMAYQEYLADRAAR